MRPAAYAIAIIGILITAPFAANAEAHGIVVAILGGTLAATPYVIVRALEEVLAESAGRKTGASTSESSSQADLGRPSLQPSLRA
jgi:L-serine deaminase